MKDRGQNKTKAEGNNPRARAFRGLVLSLLLSVVNFAGLLLTAMGTGMLKGWTTWQFGALFGTIEAAAGLACIFLPNIWHLPVAEVETSRRTQVRLALSSVLVPHWGAAARFVVGAGLIVGAGREYGVDVTAGLIALVVLMLAASMLSVSLLAARFGVARPEIDVVQFIVRWRGKTNELKPLSISASIVQFLLSIMPLPAASLLGASVMFGPELGLATGALVWMTLVTAVLAGVTLAAWTGRTSWEAPPEQQVEIEAKA
jgi:hypothetical protein